MRPKPPLPVIDELNYLLAGCQSLMEVGCNDGSRMMHLKPLVKIGWDDDKQVIDESVKQSWVRATGVQLLYGAFHQFRTLVPANSVDSVLFYSSLEHLDLHPAEATLAHAEKVAREVVIVWTPDADMTGVNKMRQLKYKKLGYYDRHRFGWNEFDLAKKGFSVLRYPSTHRMSQDKVTDSLLGWKRRQ